jgi:hypothetical protein
LALRGTTTSRLVVSAVILLAGFGSAALAQNAGPPAAPAAPAAAPAPLPQNPRPGTAAPPAAAPGAATDLQSCLNETGDYVTHGNAVTYVIGIANTCDKRLKCTIDAYVVGARGPASGRTTMILGAQSSGAAAKKTYAMRVKSAGGTAQVSRDCKVF